MFAAQPYRLTALRGLAALALGGLAGCAMDREADVRAQLDTWVELGATSYFQSTMECTAGVFATGSQYLSAPVQTVRSVRQGLLLMGHDIAVAFDVSGQTPTLVSEAVMTADLPKGLGVLSSGVAAKGCMDDTLTRSYLAALHSDQAMLIFDPASNVMAVLDRAGERIFYARGNI
ncbi:hypothetical protein QEZ52_15985 [Aliisedimentitalea scapharcae]|uniref:Lipoprotein n=1 Tax=Aliisedimentitalea scapharcae TaxID=1524259 RepID=A0ABZ2XQC6_9RHOB|nr:hypothetical protein K3727_15910 [Rhodobacteraceae bacterium M382]